MTTAPVGGRVARFCSWVRPNLPCAEQERVARERRIERVGRAGVGADRLHPDALDRRLLGQPLGAGDRDAGRVAAVGVRVRVGASGRPSRSGEQPAAGRAAGRARPRNAVDVLDLEQEVRRRPPPVRSRRARRPARPAAGPAPARRRRPSRPVTQWIGASKCVPVCSPVEMLFQYQAGPRSSYRLISLERERPGLAERLGQREDRRLGRQRGGQIDHLDGAGGERGGQIGEHSHTPNRSEADRRRRAPARQSRKSGCRPTAGPARWPYVIPAVRPRRTFVVSTCGSLACSKPLL